MIVVLDWPNSNLSPNARGHWSKLAMYKKAYRTNCRWLTKAEIAESGKPLATIPLPVRITFFPPDNRGRDTDNMLSSIKSGLDGIADEIGIDDRHWQLTIERGAVRKGGAVAVQIGAQP